MALPSSTADAMRAPTCLSVIENWYWHSPLPLSTDTPVVTALCHGSDAVLTNRRHPADVTNGIKSSGSAVKTQ